MTINEAIWITIITGLVSYIGMLVAKDNKTSEFRLLWMETLRDEVCNFSSLARANMATKKIAQFYDNNGDKHEAVNLIASNIETQLKELFRARYKISLLLNVKDAKHEIILNQLERIVTESKHSKIADNEMSKYLDSLGKSTQDVLKDEWNRVKNGENTYKYVKFGMPYLLVFLFTVVVTFHFIGSS